MTEAGIEKGWTADELERRYYIWLTNWVYRWTATHSKLLRRLYETSFRVVLMMDENRVSDGLALRTRFVYETGLGSQERDMLKAGRPCSVLEGMIALALRFEEEYMAGYDEEEEDPVGKWFAPMLDSLGLISDTDDVIDRDDMRVSLKLTLFLDRAYRPDGLGGLFYIPGTEEDMREIEIWRQMMMWNIYMNNGGK